ncbi:amino acid adenylation domain-containing protein [Streptomyces sp. NPDC058295]|uniref:amino acid adenylation domain-containing protein n=1 Tax=Streptomyces sp. NPDC058295 TaxID=3346431 RepID=UPI0036E9B0D1
MIEVARMQLRIELRPTTGASGGRALSPAETVVALAALVHRFSGHDLSVQGRRSEDLLFPAPLLVDADLMACSLAESLTRAELRQLEDRAPDVTVTVDAVPGNGSEAVVELAEHLAVDGLGNSVARAVQHFADQIARLPHLPLSEISTVAPHEETRLLALSGDQWDDTASLPLVHQLVERQALLRPDSSAVSEGTRELTYAELHSAAVRASQRLRAAGIRSGSLVGLMTERSLDAIVALLAVAMAGAASVPLDPSYPAARLRIMLDDPRIAAVVYSGEPVVSAPAGTAMLPLAELTDQADPGSTPRDAEPGHAEAPEDALFTLVFTSGSTGVPKGVEITHRGVARLVTDEQCTGFAADDVVLQFAPLTFDACFLEIWGALARGARLELAPPGPLGLAELAEVIEERGVTVLWLTSGLFHQIAEYEADCLRGVRRLFVGGDVVSPHHVDRVARMWPHLELVNGYGPTENTTFTCFHPISHDGPTDLRTSVPIGRPVARTRVHVLDRYGQLVPPGVPGELWVSGEGLARGYALRPDLTAERFVTPQEGPLRGVRMYRTGDRVRFLADGALEFLGRTDLQVKVNGFRIELPEIESALLACDGVRQACVIVEQDAVGGKRLASYVVAEDTDGRLGLELRKALRAQLPHYMVPTRYTVLDELPLTHNGKVDRARLAATPSNKD